jgi:nitroreductase
MANDILQTLYARKSVRVFEDRPISQEYRKSIIKAAFEAPTAGNQQLYTILDITDQVVKVKLSELCDNQPFIATAPFVLVFIADCKRWLDSYQAAGCKPRKPGLGDILLATADSIIAAQNAVIAAESLGIGSCYIGDVIENCEQMRELLNLPDEVMPAAMLVFGWPTQQQQERKKPLRCEDTYIVFENSYQTLTPAQHREMFQIRAEKEQKPIFDYDSWIKAFWQRKYESDFSIEMNRSAGIYLKSFIENSKV